MPLVGWWPLTGEKGKATDYSGNQNHGTVNGNPSRGVAGRGGLQSLSFDGVDDYIDITQSSVFNFSSESFSLGFWIRHPPPSSFSAPLVNRDAGDTYEGYSVNRQTDRNGVVFATEDGSGVDNLEATATVYGNSWHHVLCVYDNGSGVKKIYVDGKLDVSNSGLDLGNLSNVSNMNIGARTQNSRNDGYLNGEMGDVRIYDHALTHQEVQEIYRQGNADVASPPGTHKGKAYTTSDTVAYFPFNGSISDQWGNIADSEITDNTDASPSYTAGVRGQSKKFDGSDDEIIVSDSSSLDTVSQTVSFWMKSQASDGQGYGTGIIGKSGYSGSWAVELDDAGENVQYYVTVNGTRARLFGQPITPNEWQQNTYTYNRDTGEMRQYLDGVLVDATTHSEGGGAIDNTTDALVIGNSKDRNNYWKGEIDDLRIYSRALKPSEIQQIYQYGTRGVDLRRHLVNKR